MLLLLLFGGWLAAVDAGGLLAADGWQRDSWLCNTRIFL
jgi:hypothetical protein